MRFRHIFLDSFFIFFPMNLLFYKRKSYKEITYILIWLLNIIITYFFLYCNRIERTATSAADSDDHSFSRCGRPWWLQPSIVCNTAINSEVKDAWITTVYHEIKISYPDSVRQSARAVLDKDRVRKKFWSRREWKRKKAWHDLPSVAIIIICNIYGLR